MQLSKLPQHSRFTGLVLRITGCLLLLQAPGVAFGQPSERTAQATDGTSAASAKPNESPPTKEQCLEAHRDAQAAQNERKLGLARERARTCASLACPGLVVSDCARWLNDVDQRMPSVVFEVRVAGQPNLGATIFADDNPVQDWTKGEALRLDPGEHQFRFELAPYQPIVQNVILGEGVRYRVLQVDFQPPSQPTQSGSAQPDARAATNGTTQQLPHERPTPVIVYPLLGAGVLGVAAFTTFGLIGMSKQKDLESRCEPNCTDGDISPMKTSYLIGDISLGVGVAALVAAGVIYLGRPEKAASTTVGIAPMRGGATTFATYSF